MIESVICFVVIFVYWIQELELATYIVSPTINRIQSWMILYVWDIYPCLYIMHVSLETRTPTSNDKYTLMKSHHWCDRQSVQLQSTECITALMWTDQICHIDDFWLEQAFNYLLIPSPHIMAHRKVLGP